MDQRKIAALIDKQEIREVILRWCRGVDRGDADMIAATYFDDAGDRHGTLVAKGPDMARRLSEFSHSVRFMSHHVSNILIELAGDLAAAETYFLATTSKEDNVDGVAVMGGRYLDRFERREGEWRIADRKTMFDWHFLVPGSCRLDEAREASFLPRGDKIPQDELYALLGSIREKTG